MTLPLAAIVPFIACDGGLWPGWRPLSRDLELPEDELDDEIPAILAARSSEDAFFMARVPSEMAASSESAWPGGLPNRTIRRFHIQSRAPGIMHATPMSDCARVFVSSRGATSMNNPTKMTTSGHKRNTRNGRSTSGSRTRRYRSPIATSM